MEKFVLAYELAKSPKPHYKVQTPLGWDELDSAHRYGNYQIGDRVAISTKNGTKINVCAHIHIKVQL